jgi:type IV pilus assembly protein PilC
MVSAGLPLVQSLKGLSLAIKEKNFQEVIHQMGTDVSEGTSFSRSLEKYPQIFNKIFVNLIRAGENSGKLGQILAQLTSYLEYTYNLRRKVISARIYPSGVIVTFALLLVFVMVVAIIPKFERIYHGFGRAFPLPTQILLGVSSLIRNHFALGAILVILLLGGEYLFSLTPRGRIIIDRIKLNLPVFGPIIKKSILSNFSRTFSVLVVSGMPLVSALWLATQAINNLTISQNLTEIINSIEQGAGVGEGFKRKEFFPEMMVQMITTGEKAGSMDEMVLRAADFYEKAG